MRTVSGSRPSSSWKAAECSESTGRIRPSPFLHAVVASSPPATRLSLFASARSTPRSSAQNVAGSPAKPTTAFRTTSGSARSRSSVRSPPTWVSGARPSIVLRARRGGDELELGMGADDLERLRCRSTRSLRGARRASCLKSLGLAQGEDCEVGGRGREEERVDRGRGRRRGRAAAGRCPSCRGRASRATRRGRRGSPRRRSPPRGPASASVSANTASL